MRDHRASRIFLIALAAAATAGPGRHLDAQAFGLNEIGSCAIARGFANTGSPCRDASMIFWNPAAPTRLPGWNVTAGVAAISLNGKFQQDTTGREFESDIPTAWVPHVFVNYHPTRGKLAYGLGVYVPYGLTSQWGDDFPGRFQAKKASLRTIYVQPNIAWQMNPQWSIGAGPIFGFSNVELIQALDLSQQATPTGATFGQLGIPLRTEFARARLKGSANAFGGQFGIYGEPSPHWSVGARYLTQLEFKYDDADATFTQTPTGLVLGGTIQPPFVAGTPVDALLAGQFTTGGKLVSQKVSTKITHPDQFEVGVGYTGVRNLNLAVDYAWIGWSKFDVLPVTFADPTLSRTLIEDYTNTSTIRLGAEYTLPENHWRLRGGFVGAQSAAPAETVTPLLPEQERNYYTLGVGIPFMMTWALDVSYAYVHTPGARGRIVERSSESQTAAQLNSGFYSLSANVFSLTLKASF